jgi:hypothetical protein
MSTLPERDRSISPWLTAEASDPAPERLLNVSRTRIRATRQRRVWWATWGISNPPVPAAPIAAATAVLILAAITVSLIPVFDGDHAPGVAPLSPSPSPSRQQTDRPSASPSPRQSPRPSSSPAVSSPEPSTPVGLASAPTSPFPVFHRFPELNDTVFGRFAATVAGVRLTFDISTPGWHPSAMSGQYDGGVIRGPDFEDSFGFWSPNVVMSDPCDSESGRPVGPTAADLATAIASIPGVDVVAPTNATVDGHKAKYLEVTVPADLVCPGSDDQTAVTLWRFGDLHSGMGHAFGPGHRILVWIVDVDGARIFIEANMSPIDVTVTVRDIREIVDSIRFE